MFINIKLGKLFKIFCVFVAILMIIFFCIGIYKIIIKANKEFTVSDSIKASNVVELTTANYTNVLKAVHEDIDKYVGTKINFTGYVYRVFDLDETQFVLARDMIINPSHQTVVVGFLSSCKNAKDYQNSTWVEITGIITKGNYHGDIPIVEITEIKQVKAPTDEYVYPPDDSYIPTNALL